MPFTHISTRPPLCQQKEIENALALRRRDGPAFADLEAARAWLAARPEVSRVLTTLSGYQGSMTLTLVPPKERKLSAQQLKHDLRKELHPYLHLTEWTLLEEVGRWHDAADPERLALGREWRYVLDRKLKWRMSHEVVLQVFEPQRGQSGFMKAEEKLPVICTI